MESEPDPSEGWGATAVNDRPVVIGHALDLRGSTLRLEATMLHGQAVRRPEIRAARTDDVETVISLWMAAAENADRPADHRQAVDALLERDPGALILAYEDRDMVGTIIAGWDGWRAHLYRLAVRPDRRRRGVARALLDAAQLRLVALGATRLDAMVLNANEDGRQLWGHAGYAPQQEWRRWVRYVE